MGWFRISIYPDEGEGAVEGVDASLDGLSGAAKPALERRLRLPTSLEACALRWLGGWNNCVDSFNQ